MSEEALATEDQDEVAAENTTSPLSSAASEPSCSLQSLESNEDGEEVDAGAGHYDLITTTTSASSSSGIVTHQDCPADEEEFEIHSPTANPITTSGITSGERYGSNISCPDQ